MHDVVKMCIGYYYGLNESAEYIVQRFLNYTLLLHCMNTLSI